MSVTLDAIEIQKKKVKMTVSEHGYNHYQEASARSVMNKALLLGASGNCVKQYFEEGSEMTQEDFDEINKLQIEFENLVHKMDQKVGKFMKARRVLKKHRFH